MAPAVESNLKPEPVSNWEKFLDILLYTGEYSYCNLIFRGVDSKYDGTVQLAVQKTNELTLEEEQQLLEDEKIASLIAETNATGYEVVDSKYDAQSHTFNVSLVGESNKDACYCGHKINVTAARGEEGLHIVAAEIDPWQEPDIDF